ncbi:hypothetical protein BH09PLA1_BH09PLA1_13050 [soil metagenome]
MQSFIRTHSKKFLAILGVVLMVAFILPSQRGFLGESGSGYLVGRLGDKKVYNTDIHRAKQQWDFIEQSIVVLPQTAGGQMRTLANALSGHPAMSILAAQVQAHPELFYLLQQEADRSGIVVLPGDMDDQFKQRGFAVRLPNGVITPLEDVTDPQYAAAIRDALAALVKVERSLNRAMSAMKISRPLRDHEIARQLQQIQLELVDFTAADLLGQVPAPSADDLKKHFDMFAEFLPDEPPSARNPHGFGYKYPNRVTLQYLAVRHADVRAVVMATKTAHGWEVEAQKHYQRHYSQYQTTQPTTRPGMSSATPNTGPTTKPFEEVRDEIIDTLITPEINSRARGLQDRISSRLRDDYTAWHAKNPNPRTMASTQGATQPAAGAGSGDANDYGSFEYLQKLASEMEKQAGIRPVIASLNQYQTDKDLQAVEGIGLSMANQIPFPAYATQLAAEVVPEAERDKPIVLPLYKPSPILRDAAGSTYVFRLTGVLPSAKPQSMDEVADAVLRDWKIAHAYEMASKRAHELIDAAEKSSLASAATEAKVKSFSTGVFDSTSTSIENLSISPAALNKFRFDALGLLSTAATQPTAPPLRLIELPAQNRILVAQLLSAKPRIDTAALPMIDALVENELQNQMAEPIFKSWFDYNQVLARTGYQDQTERKSKSSS